MYILLSCNIVLSKVRCVHCQNAGISYFQLNSCQLTEFWLCCSIILNIKNIRLKIVSEINITKNH